MQNSREEAIGHERAGHSQYHLSFLRYHQQHLTHGPPKQLPVSFLLILVMAEVAVVVVEVVEAGLLVSFPRASEVANAVQVYSLLPLGGLPSFLLLLSWLQASSSECTTLAPVLVSAGLVLNAFHLDESTSADFNYQLFNSMAYLFDVIVCRLICDEMCFFPN